MTDRARYASLLRETAGRPLGASLRSLALSLRAEERLSRAPPPRRGPRPWARRAGRRFPGPPRMRADQLRMLARALRRDPDPAAIEDAAAALNAIAIEREDGQ